MKTVNFESIKGGKGDNPVRDALEEVRENLDVYVEYYAIQAKIRRSQYVALIEEGFTEEQALIIVKEPIK